MKFFSADFLQQSVIEDGVFVVWCVLAVYLGLRTPLNSLTRKPNIISLWKYTLRYTKVTRK